MLTYEEEQEIIQMYIAQPPIPISKICAETGYQAPTIYTVLDKYTIPRRRSIAAANVHEVAKQLE